MKKNEFINILDFWDFFINIWKKVVDWTLISYKITNIIFIINTNDSVSFSHI